MEMHTLLDKVYLRIINMPHCDEKCCEHSFGSTGESAAHPPERLGEQIHDD